MIGSRISPMPGCVPKINRAIGTPDASVFFDPQNIAAIRSSRENPSARDASAITSIAIENNIAAPATTAPSVPQP